MPAPLHSRQSYHTDLKLALQVGIAPRELHHRIPRSTLHRFKTSDYSMVIGNEYSHVVANMETLKTIAVCRTAIAAGHAVARLAAFVKRLRVPWDQIALIRHPELKRRVVTMVTRLKSQLPLAWILKQLGLTMSRFSSWSRNLAVCVSSPWSLCRRSHPNQLTKAEVNTIKKAFSNPEYAHEPAISCAWRLIHDGSISANAQTIVRYAKALGLTKQRKPKKPSRKKGSIAATRPDEVWHTDVTFVTALDHTKKAVHLVMDNFSRKILSYAVADHPSWESTVTVLKQAQSFVSTTVPDPTVLISDGGGENVNSNVSAVVSELSINHLIAKRDVLFSNSMIEAANKILKYQSIFRMPIASGDVIEAAVQKAVERYNDRPHYALHGLSPNQFYAGEVFDRAAYRQRILEAGKNRLAVNRSSCPPC